MNPLENIDELRHYLQMELLPKFTDDYIDEWTSDNNDIEGLHKIIDDLANTLVEIVAQERHKAATEARIDELEQLIDNLYVGGKNAGEQMDDRLKELREEV